MAYKGLSVFKQQELTSMRRLREGGPGSGPRPGKHTKDALNRMARDNGHGPEEYHKFIAGDSKSQGLLAGAERAFSKMSSDEKDIMTAGEQSEQSKVTRKYGEDGKAANQLLNRVFDPPQKDAQKSEEKSNQKAESYAKSNGLSAKDAERFGKFVGSGQGKFLKDSSPKGVLNHWKEYYK